MQNTLSAVSVKQKNEPEVHLLVEMFRPQLHWHTSKTTVGLVAKSVASPHPI